MKQQLNSIASGAATAGLFLVGAVMAGLGLTVVFSLALFGLAFAGLGLLAAPLLALVAKTEAEDREEVAA